MAIRIGLITTGECERRALPASLAGAFAGLDATFEHAFRRPVDPITSNPLSYPAPAGGAPTFVDRFVEAIAATILQPDAPDFVFAVDDLELANREAPQHVVSLLRDSITRRLLGCTHRQAERFQRRCSIHFLCPMVEAYFFGEPAALARAGATRAAQLEPTRSLERLLVLDAAYLAPPDERDHPWRSAERAAHPKRYLKYLCNPEDAPVKGYKETKGGAAALAALDWRQVFARPPAELAFAASLFEDLADALGVASPFPGACHPLTQRRADGVLRNL